MPFDTSAQRCSFPFPSFLTLQAHSIDCHRLCLILLPLPLFSHSEGALPFLPLSLSLFRRTSTATATSSMLLPCHLTHQLSDAPSPFPRTLVCRCTILLRTQFAPPPPTFPSPISRIIHAHYIDCCRLSLIRLLPLSLPPSLAFCRRIILIVTVSV